jgi:hypothetical protein
VTILFATQLAVIGLIDFDRDCAVILGIFLQVFDFLVWHKVFGEFNPKYALLDLRKGGFDLVKGPATENGQNGKS